MPDDCGEFGTTDVYHFFEFTPLMNHTFVDRPRSEKEKNAPREVCRLKEFQLSED